MTDMRARIVEGLTGAIGDPERVREAARACGERCLANVAEGALETLGESVRFTCVSVELSRFADARPAPGGFGAMAVAPSSTSPDALLMTLDASGMAIVVSGAFGADPDLGATPLSRLPSPIEAEIAGKVFELFAEAFNGSGDRAMKIRFPLPAPMIGEDIDKHIVRDGPAVTIGYAVGFGEGEVAGRLEVTIPQRVLSEHRGEAAASASGWRERFNEEVMRSTVRLEATVALERMTLGELATMQLGQVLEMPEGAQARTRLSAKDKTLFQCEFGKLGQNYTVRIVQPFDAQQDFVEGLMSA